MKKLISSVVLSVPLFLASFPSFSVSTSTLYNPESRTDGAYSTVYNNNLPKAGTNYAYWRHWHRGYWHRGGHWHRGWGWHRWHRWHHWHYG